MTTLSLNNEVTGTFTAPSDSQEFTIANKKDFGDKRLDLVGTFSAAGTFDGGTLLLQGYDGAAWNDIAMLTAAGAVRVGPASAVNYRVLMSGGTAPSVTWWVNSELWFEGSGSTTTPPPSGGTNRWDPQKKGTGITLSNGDLTATLPAPPSSNLIEGIMAIQPASSGKFYWEVTCLVPYTSIGVAYYDWAGQLGSLDSNNLFSYYSLFGTLKHSDDAYGDPYGVGDIVGVALDLDNHKIWFSKNGIWQAGGDPAAGTNPAYSTMPPNSGLYYPACGLQSFGTVAEVTANFGASPYIYTVPSGFTASAP